MDALVMDVVHWGEASVTAMLQTCADCIATMPERLDPKRPRPCQCAFDLYNERNKDAKSWYTLSDEDRKMWEDKWQCEREALQNNFLEREQSWKEQRRFEAEHLEKVRRIFGRRISQGLVKTDFAILMRMLASKSGGVRMYFVQDEQVAARKPATGHEEYQRKTWKYSLQRGFESLGSVAETMIAAHPDFWAIFVFDLVAGLPGSKKTDGSFAGATMGIVLDSSFLPRLEKVLEALCGLGIRLLKEHKLKPVQLISVFTMLLILTTDSLSHFGNVPSWLKAAFSNLVAALDADSRALLLDALLLSRFPEAVDKCWEQTVRSSLHLASELPRLRLLPRFMGDEDKRPCVEQLMEAEVFVLFANAGKKQICNYLMEGDSDSFLFWAPAEILQAMSLELQISCINWLGAHVRDLVEHQLLDRVEVWLDAFSDSSQLLQSLAVLLMPIFPQILDVNQKSYERVLALACPHDISVTESVEAPEEPAQKRSRLE